MPETNADGCGLSWSVDGPADAPALLLLNALGTTVDLWRTQIDRLAAAFRVIRFDTRGHGASEAPPGPYALDRLGHDALAVLDAAGARRAHVCGVSLGGQTALWLAIHAPERVTGVVAANTGARIGTTALWNQRIRDARDAGHAGPGRAGDHSLVHPRGFGGRDPETVDRFRTDAGRMLGQPATRAAAPPCATPICARNCTASSAPRWSIVGADDYATPPAAGRAICDQVAGAELLALDAAHLANVERADAFAAGVLAFLTRIPR